MCAASRARSLAVGLALLCGAASPAFADPPAISGSPAPAPAAPAAPVAPAPAWTAAPAPTAVAPQFTPRQEPPFTPAGREGAAPPPVVAPAEQAAHDARFADAHLDRVVLVPTAETHPAGTTYLSSYDIVGLQVGHALSDRVQLTLSFIPILAKDPIVPLDVTLKGIFVRERRVRVAAMASGSGIFGFEDGAAAVGRVGGVTQLCFDDGCRSSISMAATVVFAGPVFLVADGVGVVYRVSHLVSLLGEVQSVLPVGRDGGEIHALGGAFGVRLSGRSLALDIAFESALDRKTNPQLIPVLVGTYRFLP